LLHPPATLALRPPGVFEDSRRFSGQASGNAIFRLA
jgi:hypothetical protein